MAENISGTRRKCRRAAVFFLLPSHFNCNLLFNFVSASLVQLIIKLNCSVNIKKRREKKTLETRRRTSAHDVL